MFVSSKMMEVCSNITWLFIWMLYIVFLGEGSPLQIFCLIAPKIIIKILISYCSCILVSRVQSSKTMLKILLACNLKLN
jgi:hypothetical protein